MTRITLPSRRPSSESVLSFPINGNMTEFAVTYGFNSRARVVEVFCKPFKLNTDMQLILRQTSMAISVALQHGAWMAELEHVLGEDDLEIAPRSIIGLIVRAGANLDRENGHRWVKP